jgi:cephalosporin-C deacetylase-like acetyl esterase
MMLPKTEAVILGVVRYISHFTAISFLIVLLLTVSLCCGQTEFIDGSPPTQQFGMHVCPAGSAMGGAHVSDNRFLCRPVDEIQQDCFVDYSTQRQGMHACPSGSYMRGYHDGRNELLCCFDRRAGNSHLGQETLDTGTQDHGMHVCTGHRASTVMIGIHNGKNRFLCSAKLPHLAASSLPITNQDPSQPRSFLSAPRTTSQDRAAWQFATWQWLAHQLRLNTVKGYTPPAMPGARSMAPPAPTASIIHEQTVEGTKQLTIQYASPIDQVPEQAFLILPPNYDPHKRFPAVVVTHGHNESCKDSLARNWNDADHAAALYFAQQGAIALAPDTRSFCSYRTALQRANPLLFSDHHALTSRLPLGTLPSEYILDNMARISLLLARSDVDPARIFTAGLSLGSYQAMWTAALDDRVAKVVAGDLFLDLHCLDSSRVNHECQTIPSISRDYEGSPNDHNKTVSQGSMLIDTADLAALIAPRPLLVVWGTADHFFTDSPDCARKAMGEAASVYQAFGEPGNFSVQLIPGMQHEFEDFTSSQFLLGSATPRRDYGTQENGMHVCPDGWGMIGIHDANNQFLCAKVPSADISCRVDPALGANPTQRDGIHACPTGFYMQGAHVGDNRFTCCQSPAVPISSEVVDQNNQVEGMHGCPQNQTGLPHFMTGLHAGQNRLLCQH